VVGRSLDDDIDAELDELLDATGAREDAREGGTA
jgi:hypothetical protein